MMTKTHQFMEIKSSPWPMTISMWLLNNFLSLILLIKFGSPYFYSTTIMMILNTMKWWDNLSKEINLKGSENMIMETMNKKSMMMFIISELMIFMSMFWSYYQFYLSPTLESSMQWPPNNIKMMEWDKTPTLNTIILLSSSITLTLSHQMMMKGMMKNMVKTMWITVTLGIVFSILQLTEYKNSFFTMSDSTYGSIFYMTTGTHGLHVLMGTTILASNLTRNMNMMMGKNNSIMMELGSWYWHFVDLIWIYLFFSIYYMS